VAASHPNLFEGGQTTPTNLWGWFMSHPQPSGVDDPSHGVDRPPQFLFFFKKKKKVYYFFEFPKGILEKNWYFYLILAV
jgi:hypothetical protein